MRVTVREAFLSECGLFWVGGTLFWVGGGAWGSMGHYF